VFLRGNVLHVAECRRLLIVRPDHREKIPPPPCAAPALYNGRTLDAGNTRPELSLISGIHRSREVRP
jgi:hypothetical protein